MAKLGNETLFHSLRFGNLLVKKAPIRRMTAYRLKAYDARNNTGDFLQMYFHSAGKVRMVSQTSTESPATEDRLDKCRVPSTLSVFVALTYKVPDRL